MDSAVTSRRIKNTLNISVAPRFDSTRLSASSVRGVLTIAVFSGLLLMARAAQAQTYTDLYDFTHYSNYPTTGPVAGLTSDGAGNFYGTTNSGGYYLDGTVFELTPNGNGGWNAATLYTFTGHADGRNPGYGPLVRDSLGNLYGTTQGGGANVYGVAYELSLVGGSWTQTVLYSFTGGQHNSYPSGLVMDSAGNLFGTTFDYYGRRATGGGVFELSQSGGVWTEKLIYTYHLGSFAGLTMDAAGNLYGIGSAGNNSTVFKLSRNPKGGWNPRVLYTFPTAVEKGAGPNGTLAFDNAGNLYGTTTGGSQDYGTVYKLSPVKNGPWTYQLLYTFTGLSDGSHPFAGVTLDAAGNIYGSTKAGGKSYGYGTVFELVPDGQGSYTERVLWSFNGFDGFQPYGGLLLNSAGNLFGTTSFGGSYSSGNAFEVTP